MDFENLYVRTVQYLKPLPQAAYPVHGIGDMTTYRLLRSDNNITAVMLVVENRDTIPQEQREDGRAMPLKWVLENTPKSLKDAVVSWVTFKHELNPTTILIHKEGDIKEVREMCYTRLFSEFTRNKRQAELTEALKKVKEIADEAYISEGKTKEDFLAQVGLEK